MDPNLVRAPSSVAELAIPRSLVHDLVMRRALLDGNTSTLRLAQSLALSPTAMEEAVEDLRTLKLLEVQGLERRNYLLTLTDAGHHHAMERMKLSRYAGAAPVSLDTYSQVIEFQQPQTDVNMERIREAFSDLVVNDSLLRDLGPGFRSKGAMFLYGPPGTGKSSIAERLIKVHDDHILIPQAVEVDGQVITVFDPIVHNPAPSQPDWLDPRWVACERPCVIAGGELTGTELDLTYEANSGIYLAPLQMQANNGILVIDDFGRQQLTPEQLLNRWIVPLDRGIDYLTLSYGLKFQVPCTPKIVFSTNLAPSDLGDEAFFRRIRSKVLIPAIEDEQFDEVLRRVAAAKDVTLAEGVSEHLRWVSRNRGDGDLRPYLPGAVCDLVQSICDFERTSRLLDNTMVDRVATLYFTHADKEPASSEGVTKATGPVEADRPTPLLAS